MANDLVAIPIEDAGIRSRILTIRGVQVILDWDIAELYGVETRVLNQAVKRNMARFPDKFRFQLTREELTGLITNCDKFGNKRHYPGLPAAFTEQGVAMLSAVLRSPTAIDISIRIMDAFVAMRRFIVSNAAVLQRIENVEVKQITMDAKLNRVLDAMQDKTFPPQKVFFDGQFYDAFDQMKKFIRSAKKSLIIIDPYFSDSVLPLIAQKRAGVQVTIVNSPRGAKQLHAVDVERFNAQYADTLTVKTSDKFHDRFLIIDEASIIHIGASLNNLGKKCFAFSTFDPSNVPELLAKIATV